MVLATKVAGYAERLSYLRSPRETTRLTRQQVLASVDASLKRLGTDYIDLLQLHVSFLLSLALLCFCGGPVGTWHGSCARKCVLLGGATMRALGVRVMCARAVA